MFNENEKAMVRKLAIVCGFILGTALLVGAPIGLFKWNQIRKAEMAMKKQEEDRVLAQKKIQEMVILCGFRTIDPEDRAKIDACGTDVEKVRTVLSDMVDTRINFWVVRRGEVLDNLQKVEKIKREAGPYWTNGNEQQYQEVKDRLEGNLEDAKRIGGHFLEARDKLRNF